MILDLKEITLKQRMIEILFEFLFGQNEEVPYASSNEAYPIISKPAGSSYKYIAASVHGDVGSVVIVLP